METLGNIDQAAALVVMVLAIFAGLAIPRAYRLDRRDANEAVNKSVHEGDTNE